MLRNLSAALEGVYPSEILRRLQSLCWGSPLERHESLSHSASTGVGTRLSSEKMTAGIPVHGLGGQKLQCSPSECLMVSFEVHCVDCHLSRGWGFWFLETHGFTSSRSPSLSFPKCVSWVPDGSCLVHFLFLCRQNPLEWQGCWPKTVGWCLGSM